MKSNLSIALCAALLSVVYAGEPAAAPAAAGPAKCSETKAKSKCPKVADFHMQQEKWWECPTPFDGVKCVSMALEKTNKSLMSGKCSVNKCVPDSAFDIMNHYASQLVEIRKLLESDVAKSYPGCVAPHMTDNMTFMANAVIQMADWCIFDEEVMRRLIERLTQSIKGCVETHELMDRDWLMLKTRIKMKAKLVEKIKSFEKSTGKSAYHINKAQDHSADNVPAGIDGPFGQSHKENDEPVGQQQPAGVNGPSGHCHKDHSIEDDQHKPTGPDGDIDQSDDEEHIEHDQHKPDGPSDHPQDEHAMEQGQQKPVTDEPVKMSDKHDEPMMAESESKPVEAEKKAELKKKCNIKIKIVTKKVAAEQSKDEKEKKSESPKQDKKEEMKEEMKGNMKESPMDEKMEEKKSDSPKDGKKCGSLMGKSKPEKKEEKAKDMKMTESKSSKDEATKVAQPFRTNSVAGSFRGGNTETLKGKGELLGAEKHGKGEEKHGNESEDDEHVDHGHGHHSNSNAHSDNKIRAEDFFTEHDNQPGHKEVKKGGGVSK